MSGNGGRRWTRFLLLGSELLTESMYFAFSNIYSGYRNDSEKQNESHHDNAVNKHKLLTIVRSDMFNSLFQIGSTCTGDSRHTEAESELQHLQQTGGIHARFSTIFNYAVIACPLSFSQKPAIH